MINWICENQTAIIWGGIIFVIAAFAIRGIFYTVFGRLKSKPGYGKKK